MTNRRQPDFLRSITIVLCSLSLMTNTSRADLSDLVRVAGVMENSDDMGGLIGSEVLPLPTSCEQRGYIFWEFLEANPALGPLVPYAIGGLNLAADVLEWTPPKKEDLENRCAEQVDGDFQVFYTSCSMTMFVGPIGAPVQFLRWTVPPLSSEAAMVALSGKKGVSVKLETSLEQLRGQALDIDMSAKGMKDPEEFTNLQTNVQTPDNTGATLDANENPLQVTRTFKLPRRDYEARLYTYDYAGQMNPLQMAQSQQSASGFGIPLIKVENEGWAYVAADVEGLDVVRMFYSNFERYVVQAAGEGSLLGGMVEQMSKLIDYGLPLKGENTNTTSMEGVATMRMGSSSSFTIKDVGAAPLVGSDLCAPTVIPEGFEVTELDPSMGLNSSATSIGGASGAQGMPEMEQAMNGLSEAMAQMTPEQQAMMQQFGIGVPGAGGSGAAAAVSATSVSTAAIGATASAALMTDDLGQSTQLHLQALGYEPGNTDGFLDTMTQVAVSQFQAENGLAVTGDISPQLLGHLAAAVDRNGGN